MFTRALLKSSSWRRKLATSKHASPFLYLRNQKRSASTNKPATLRQLSESFANGTSSHYLESMYTSWKRDPSSVHVSWATYFSQIDSATAPGDAFMPPPSLASSAIPSGGGTATSSVMDRHTMDDALKMLLLVRAYQVRGHEMSNLDPLGLRKPEVPKELRPDTYGFKEEDMDRVFELPSFIGLAGFLGSGKKRTLRGWIEALQKCYCGPIGVEFMHISDREECNWVRENFEREDDFGDTFTNDQRDNLLDRLVWASQFELFLGKKFGPGNKRFGLDGCEVLIPGMKHMVDVAGDLGVNSVVMGMAHRGRLNVLANVVRKPLEHIFYEFDAGAWIDENYGGTGDVKYHLGTSYDRPTKSGKKIHLSLLANPSHLEAVCPLVEGKVKSKQYFQGNGDYNASMSVLIHGDASFAGQGVVYETVNITATPKYATGGTIHIVINNQIGFTTLPKDARGGLYCTDVVKAQGCPIFHVNGDHPEAVSYVFQKAVEYRQLFKKDCVIDVICYRRHGHNEGDQPTFTQPIMYKVIKQQKPVVEKYAQILEEKGITSRDQYKAKIDHCNEILQQRFDLAKEGYEPKKEEWLESRWHGFLSPTQFSRIKTTGVSMEKLQKVGRALYSYPDTFNVHPTLKKILERKKQIFETGEGLDFATAEALAFGTLLLEGFHVRLSGQDSERGTFAHRHAVLHDQKTGEELTLLNQLEDRKEIFSVINSPLSEFGILGYELGVSLENPNQLVVWEAQFGDFANGAQVIIDQFISCGEAKWFRQSGIVLLLPHGYEGQGPEHSSARIERFLNLTDSDPDQMKEAWSRKELEAQIQQHNWQVVICTTPANYYHVLRRQIHRKFRKPLIVFTHKSILRTASSRLNEIDDKGDNTRFLRVIDEVGPGALEYEKLDDPQTIPRVVFCSGKVFYTMHSYREKHNITNVALIRIEQLAPFPFDRVQEVTARYPNAEICWCQEEPKNMGAWTFFYFHMMAALRKARGENFRPRYFGRPVSASPATASKKMHEMEQQAFLEAVFDVNNKSQ